VTVNVIVASWAWDPYAFILLNLFLSMLAAIRRWARRRFDRHLGRLDAILDVDSHAAPGRSRYSL